MSPGSLAAGELRMTLARADAAPAPPLDLNHSVSPAARAVEIRYPPSPGGMPILKQPSVVGEYLRTYLGDVLSDPREHAYVLGLSTRNRLLAPPYLLAIGDGRSCGFSVQGILRYALLTNAQALILAHTHPSGDVTPSAEDKAITARAVDAARLIEIQICDHLILAGAHRAEGDRPYLSMREAGLL